MVETPYVFKNYYDEFKNLRTQISFDKIVQIKFNINCKYLIFERYKKIRKLLLFLLLHFFKLIKLDELCVHGNVPYNLKNYEAIKIL